MNIINFSASDLVKKSATQILYLYFNNTCQKPTKRQIKGNKYAAKVAKKEKAAEERRGVVSSKKYNIYFCIDLVKGNKYVEVKMVNDNAYPDWYLNSSLIQATLYATLLKNSPVLTTPTFRLKEGYPKLETKVPVNYNFELWFGEDKYLIKRSKKVKEFYERKAGLITSCIKTKDYTTVRQFDAQYKHKEFEFLNPKKIKI